MEKEDATQMDNSSTIEVIGNQNVTSNQAGRDINIDVTNTYYKPEFFRPNLEDYEEGNFVCPTETPNLIKKITTKKFLVLGGTGYNKTGLARYIAKQILGCNPGKTFEVQEWSSSSNPQNLELHLQRQTNPTIFILPKIFPQHVDYNLSEIYSSSLKRNHYIVITTDIPMVKWKPTGDVQPLFWEPISSSNLYHPDDLLNLLIKKLEKKRSALPVELTRNIFTGEGTLCGNIKLIEVAATLQTPESIDIFVQSLLNEATKKTPDEAVIQEIMDNCSNHKETLKQWFYRALSPFEQAIAIGFCLFDGIDDDQFFTAFETLVEKSWSGRDAYLVPLDYCDLETLSSYFRINFVEREGFKRLESKISGLRQNLLEITWKTHRRHILNTLPILEHLLVNSVHHNAVIINRELYRTTRKRQLLREVISETLCSIGLIPIKSIKGTPIEDTLIRLAAQGNQWIQLVAAQTIAMWRRYDQDERLFDTLERWQEEKNIHQIIRSIQESSDNPPKMPPQVYIKATVALTVGFAANYDPPNKMNLKLCNLFEKISESTSNNFILKRFTDFTLPMVLRFHTAQLQDILYHMAKNLQLNEPIGASLAIAIQEGSTDALKTVDYWYERCVEDRPAEFSPGEITHRDSLMATVAFVYGWLRYNEDGLIKFEEGFEQIRTILQKEKTPYVRKAAIKAITLQIRSNIEKIEEYLPAIFQCIEPEEKAEIIEWLVQQQIKQRQKLEYGDEYFDWKGKRYEVWIKEKRPLTEIEKVTRKWLKNPANRYSQQVALRVLTSSNLVEFEKAEEEFISEIINKEREAEDNEIFDSIPSPDVELDGELEDSTLLSKLVPSRDEKHRLIIQGLLPEVRKQRKSNLENLEFAIEKLSDDKEEEISAIGKILKRALNILNMKFPFIFIILIITIIIIGILFSVRATY